MECKRILGNFFSFPVLVWNKLIQIFCRMLKGYRDSQCGWVLIEEEADSQSSKRRVEFLIIHVPKKGLIEIWTMQFGAKVVSFNVNKDGR